ncbi:MAG: hypothetical protein CMN60_21390 [Sphingobium sp.]|nr:hypothetical protein [Sphingobium sp.]MBS50187.1 hypothetical protein [Sphingobium sp.]|tara:strand:+ start:21866 stop:22207 length:342 start_codon:yes stop_codon:yes gene_type:complete
MEYYGYLGLYLIGVLAAGIVASHHLYYNVMAFEECVNSSPWRYPLGLQPFIIICILVWPAGMLVYLALKVENRSMATIFDTGESHPDSTLGAIAIISVMVSGIMASILVAFFE